MSNPYEGYKVRVVSEGDVWRAMVIDRKGKPIEIAQPVSFYNRDLAVQTAETLAKWFSISVEEVES